MSRWFQVILTVTVLLAGAAGSARAFPFPVTDVRGLGMGGAYVAAGTGPGAAQYNPALVGGGGTIGLSLPNATARLEDHIGLADAIDAFNDSAATTTDQIAVLRGLFSGGEVSLDAVVSASVGFDAFGLGMAVGYASLLDAGIFPMPSTFDTSLPGLTDPNSNMIGYGGIATRQLVLTAAKDFGSLTVGGNLRQVQGRTYYNEESISSDPDLDVDAIQDDLSRDVNQTAIDVGVLFTLMPMVDVGLVIRDFNSPEFDLAGGGSLKYDPRYRAGVAVKLPVVRLSADYDLTESEGIGGTGYREMAVGAELDLWMLKIRGGLSRNTALGGSPTLVHLGLGLFGFLDIGAAYAEGGDYYLAGANLRFGL